MAEATLPTTRSAQPETLVYFGTYGICPGVRVVRHARVVTFQLAEVAVTGQMVRAILAAIRRLLSLCA